jgi:hypothetical protein
MHYEEPTNRVQHDLTNRQKAFAREYLVDFNATAAYKRAGYKAKGHSAEAAGQRLLRNVEVKAMIEEQIQDRADRTEITADLVIQETWKNYRRCVDAEEYAAANKSLELLGRHTGAFPNKHEHSGPNNAAIPISFIEYADAEPAEGSPSDGDRSA